MSWINLKFITIALTTTLTFAATAVYAEQQASASAASCEKQRLQCQKDGAQINSFGVPVTPTDTTKQCWDRFYACGGTGSASQSATPTAEPGAASKTTALPAMKRFEIQSSDKDKTDCRVNGTEVMCTGRGEDMSAGVVQFETTITGHLSGSVITGTGTSRIDTTPLHGGCSSHQEQNYSVTVTLKPNNEAMFQVGPSQFRAISSGPANCAGTVTGTHPAHQSTTKWKVIE